MNSGTGRDAGVEAALTPTGDVAGESHWLYLQLAHHGQMQGSQAVNKSVRFQAAPAPPRPLLRQAPRESQGPAGGSPKRWLSH